MDFTPSQRSVELQENMWEFMREHVFPAEPVWKEYLREHGDNAYPPIMDELKAEARRRVNLGTGDVAADRALLEMAGLVGGSGTRSGGSMS